MTLTLPALDFPVQVAKPGSLLLLAVRPPSRRDIAASGGFDAPAHGVDQCTDPRKFLSSRIPIRPSGSCMQQGCHMTERTETRMASEPTEDIQSEN